MDADVLKAGSQVFITGDVDHHYGIDCVEKEICVIDAGHHGLEHIFVPYMEQWLKENCPEIQTVTDRQSVTVFCHIESVFGIYGDVSMSKIHLKTGKGCFTIRGRNNAGGYQQGFSGRLSA